MEIFIVTVEFQNADDVAVSVKAVGQQAAEDHAFEYFLEEGSTGAHAVTIADFEQDFGTYAPGMFDAI